MPNWMLWLCQFSILAFAVLGGVFLAFSDFIMRSLSVTSGSGGLEAMQAINREVFRWVFMALFLGMVPVSIVIAVAAFRTLATPGPFIAAAVIYIVGVFVVTAAGNVPLNNALEGMDAASVEAMAYWTGTYVPRWTFWNTVRTVGCLLSAGILLMGVTRSVG